jgi:hypothetical protein
LKNCEEEEGAVPVELESSTRKGTPVIKKFKVRL